MKSERAGDQVPEEALVILGCGPRLAGVPHDLGDIDLRLGENAGQDVGGVKGLADQNGGHLGLDGEARLLVVLLGDLEDPNVVQHSEIPEVIHPLTEGKKGAKLCEVLRNLCRVRELHPREGRNEESFELKCSPREKKQA